MFEKLCHIEEQRLEKQQPKRVGLAQSSKKPKTKNLRAKQYPQVGELVHEYTRLPRQKLLRRENQVKDQAEDT